MATATILHGENTIVAEIFIAAPLERVFKAITDPAQLSQWWGQRNMYRITERTADVRPGGKWSSVGVGADGTKFHVDGEYLQVEPPSSITPIIASATPPTSAANFHASRSQAPPLISTDVIPNRAKGPVRNLLFRRAQVNNRFFTESSTRFGMTWQRIGSMPSMVAMFSAPRLLVHTWLASWTGDLKTIVRWELETGGDKGTLLKIRHEGFAGAPEAAQNHGEGWKRVLGWLLGFAEKGETVDARK